MNDQFDRVEEDILRYKELVKGWDGYEGTAPTEGTISSALLFISLIRLEGFPAPTTTLSSNGEVSLYWEAEGRYLEVGFEEEGTLSYLIDSKDTTKGEDDLLIAEAIPIVLREELSLISKYL